MTKPVTEIDPVAARRWLDEHGRCGDRQRHAFGDCPPVVFTCALHDFHAGPHVTWMRVADDGDLTSWAVVTWSRHPDD